MLDSQLHSNFPSLVWQIAIPRSLILLILLHFMINVGGTAAQKLQNITVPVNSPQITYTPFVCNASTELANPQACANAWMLSSSDDMISITGPTSTSGIIPQLFFQFQASILYINTVPSISNATVNLTLSAGGVNISTVFDSSLGDVSIVNLPPNQITSLTIYISAVAQTVFCMEALIITIPQNASTSSILPTPTLPSSASLPTIIPTSSSSSASVITTPTALVPTTGSKKTKIAQAVGITVGLGFGLTALAVAGFYYWKRRKQRSENVGIERAKSEWRSDPPPDLSERLSRFSQRLSRFQVKVL